MQKRSNRQIITLFFGVVLIYLSGCTTSYSFTGASIPPEARTATVIQFKNVATNVSASMSQYFTDGLRNSFQTQTNLDVVNSGGDLLIEGVITKYVPASPSAISGNQTAVQNRMTISVKVKFKNRFDPAADFDKTFTDHVEYPSSADFASIEDVTIQELTEQMVEKIFNDAVANW